MRVELLQYQVIKSFHEIFLQEWLMYEKVRYSRSYSF